MAKPAETEAHADPAPTTTWWDRRDEPPPALTARLDRVSGAFGRFVRHHSQPVAEAPESRRANLVRTAVLMALFLLIVWLILAGLLEHA